MSNDIADFLRFVSVGAPPTTYLAVSAIQITSPTRAAQHRFFRNDEKGIERATAFATASNDRGLDVYVRCSMLSEVPKHGRGKKQHTAGANVLWVDLDAEDQTQDTLKQRLRRFPVPPHWVNASGKGLHAFWKLTAFCADVAAIEAKNRWLAQSLGQDVADRCWDATRILRVPGTCNYKYEEPIDVTVVQVKDGSTIADDIPEVASDVDELDLTFDPTTLPTDFLAHLPAEFAERITKGKGAPLRDGRLDRSANDWYCACRLRELGHDAGTAFSVLSHPEWVTGDKARQQGHLYAQRTVAAAFAEAKPLRRMEQQQSRFVWSPQEFVSATFREPTWLVDRVWMDETIGFLAGEPKVKKTWTVLDLLLSIASGTKFLGKFDVLRTGPVALVQKEDPEAYLQDRVLKIAQAKGLLPDRIEQNGRKLTIELPTPFPPLYVRTDPGFLLGEEDSLRVLDDWLSEIEDQEGHAVQMLALDPLLKMVVDFDEFKASTVLKAVFLPMMELRGKHRCSIVIVHHETKHTEKKTRGGQRMYGSIAFHAFAESALYAEFDPEKPTQIIIKPEFKSQSAAPFAVEHIDLDDTYNVRVLGVRLTAEAMVECLQRLKTPQTFDTITEHFADQARANVERTLEECVQKGTVAKIQGPRKLGGKIVYTALQ
jgi:hypothetical protein